ncbi:MAG: dihydroorotate dehydrogenase electron transfer subunit [Kiritimatiellia bacterium]
MQNSDYRVLTLRSPAIARIVQPGQFIHLRVPRLDSAVLRRPFSVYRCEGDLLSILYKVVGRGTRALSRVVVDEEIDLLGPLGNGFPPLGSNSFPILAAGGYGVAPLYFLATRLNRSGVVFIGGATANDILCVDEFELLRWEVHIATEDASLGKRGLVTCLLDDWLAQYCPAVRNDCLPTLYACGPDGMLRAVAERANSRGWKAWLSLDRHMGCGVGVCLACVQAIRASDGTRQWARTCREGPVFEARELIWE